MKCLFNKKYKELANSIEYLQHIKITDHMFDGILVKGKSDEGSFCLNLEQGSVRNIVKVNEKVLLDKSQEKLSKIRDLVIKNT